jgi:two-component system chemotaxis response regulator CheY
MVGKQVLSIGQCGADHGALARTLSRHFAATVVPAEDLNEALTQLRCGTFALVLVNRVLDANGSSGLEVIRRLKVEERLASVPVMLVSNYPDAQEQAVQAGAVPGFGKSALGRPEMLTCLRAYLVG